MNAVNVRHLKNCMNMYELSHLLVKIPFCFIKLWYMHFESLITVEFNVNKNCLLHTTSEVSQLGDIENVQ